MNKKIKKTIAIVANLINENRKFVILLTIIIYELNEKKFYAKKKLNKKFFAQKNFNKNQFNEKKSLNENLIIQSKVMKKIKKKYFDDVIFRKIIKSKRRNNRRISTNIIKKKKNSKIAN